MKIRKNGKVVRLTESDLQRIVKRTLNEEEDDLAGLKPCRENDLDKIVGSLKDMDKNDIIKIEVSSNSGDVLIIDSPGGKCGCRKEDFFANV